MSDTLIKFIRNVAWIYSIIWNGFQFYREHINFTHLNGYICSFSCYTFTLNYMYNVECNMQIWWQTLQCRNTKVTWKTGNQRCQLVNRNTALMLCLQFEEYVFEFPVSIHMNRSHYGGRELMTELGVWGLILNYSLKWIVGKKASQICTQIELKPIEIFLRFIPLERTP